MNKYDSIIDLPHHVSKKHPPMPILDRAAQFAPFANLVGFEDELEEVARLVDKKAQLSDQELEILDRKLNYLNSHILDRPSVRITYFVKDEKKDGGKYETIKGEIKKIDYIDNSLILSNNQKINISDICDIDSELFK